MNDWVYTNAKKYIAQGKIVGVVRGDHSSPYGNIQACAEAHPGMGVLHLDAHADLRDAYEGFVWSHASIMFNVVTKLPNVAKLVQVGIRDFGEAEFNFIQASNNRVHSCADPGWYENPVETLATTANDIELSREGIDVAAPPMTTPGQG